MLTCKKTYQDIPFAHRQHRHDGHCAYIHGHNWGFTFTFACRELDECGFVVDFGKLGYIRDWLKENLDHACVFSEEDPLREQIVAAAPGAFKVYLAPATSSEGLAKHLHDVLNAMVLEHTRGRAWIASLEVIEDSKNTATYHAPGL
jgi:6-pyruvoyltetrahydropterin/6-carboxytetrahydropterin synthase